MGCWHFRHNRLVSKLHLWQFVTYAFVNKPEIFTLIQLVLLAFFGRDVEKFIGRKSFAWLYAVLVLAIPVLLSLLNFLGMDSGTYYGSDAVHFAVFVAFVMIYPAAEIFFGIQARWIAIALLGIYTLQMLAYRQWINLIDPLVVVRRGCTLDDAGRSPDFLATLCLQSSAPTARTPQQTGKSRARQRGRIVRVH